ncbi:MAG: hypothetical protein IAF02_08960 [Anaerolineae bacterium]|nr:hypothetical protein [Anaerolineae bacterium]
MERVTKELRHNLVNSLTEQFDREMRRSTQRIEDTVAPFAPFVLAETDKLTVQHDALVEIEAHHRAARATQHKTPTEM